ncbi:hypothetical protein [Deinococcus cellulosilyticus]|uniref:Uncharacterized protein n=1 Tax=Deinococcus cellulosilyticus (strain DSM 18568 / NBRC 106333 / KACC 11606 / 5516J-15) TaxID=1223518 RepID=A0A511N1W3_DEIC1|nr:hypothetical protein [Deinococcus cellulosilyticus]GEM46366.1 hypothetical protein DC3_20010 [Deinococcus cellulosilyticus NBRC 106333 = KACC 11606]
MTKLEVGSYVASMKAAPAQVRDRELFLERVRLRDEVPTVADLELVGLGGSCGKPAFMLPYVLRWNEKNTLALEQIARDFNCFVEYGAYPHLKLLDGGQEVAAVQDWSMVTLVFMRPGYDLGVELLTRLRDDLKD